MQRVSSSELLKYNYRITIYAVFGLESVRSVHKGWMFAAQPPPLDQTNYWFLGIFRPQRKSESPLEKEIKFLCKPMESEILWDTFSNICCILICNVLNAYHVHFKTVVVTSSNPKKRHGRFATVPLKHLCDPYYGKYSDKYSIVYFRKITIEINPYKIKTHSLKLCKKYFTFLSLESEGLTPILERHDPISTSSSPS